MFGPRKGTSLKGPSCGLVLPGRGACQQDPLPHVWTLWPCAEASPPPRKLPGHGLGFVCAAGGGVGGAGWEPSSRPLSWAREEGKAGSRRLQGCCLGSGLRLWPPGGENISGPFGADLASQPLFSRSLPGQDLHAEDGGG